MTDDRKPTPIANLDHDRARRCGFPEVVLCEGKPPTACASIAAELFAEHGRVLLTRASQEQADAVGAELPAARYHSTARCITLDPHPLARVGRVAIVAAGTADLPVAEEARTTLDVMGAATEAHFDVGVAGIHRLLQRIEAIRQARVIVAVAGMEGALPSVLAGLVDIPVIAVPTSIGYGVGQDGLAALATMLSSCAAGVAVVNIDNGFGAGYLAAKINQGPPERDSTGIES